MVEIVRLRRFYVVDDSTRIFTLCDGQRRHEKAEEQRACSDDKYAINSRGLIPKTRTLPHPPVINEGLPCACLHDE